MATTLEAGSAAAIAAATHTVYLVPMLADRRRKEHIRRRAIVVHQSFYLGMNGFIYVWSLWADGRSA